MLSAKKRLTTAIVLAAAVASQSSATAGIPAAKGWYLTQENPHTGLWKVYLSGGGMAAVNEKMGCTLVTKAPQWNVVMYNDKTKVYFLSTLNDWKGASIKANSSKKSTQYKSILVEKKPKKLKDGTILGHKATQYLTDNLASTGLKKVEFWMTPDVQAPPELKQIFSKIYGVGLTSMSGLPLKVSYIDENGKRTPVFETQKIVEQTIPLQNFTYPASYKRVDSEIAVLMDEKGREAMASIMDDIGEGEEDVNSLLDSPKGKKTAYKSPYTDKSGSTDEDDEDGGSEKEAKTETANNGDWGKAIWDWFAGIMKSLGLWKEEAPKEDADE